MSSSVHASLRWTPGGWTVKDLGSTNGSYVNGRRLDAGRVHLLARGDVLAFGVVEDGWALTDDEAPVPTAVAEDGQRASGSDLIALPSNDEPVVTLFKTPEGGWCAEGPEQARETILDGGILEVSGKRWRLSIPALVTQTDLSQQHAIEQVRLVFGVSRDEEHVELVAHVDSTTVDLGVRANNYLLLLLARQRAEDERSGVDDGSQGWMHQDDLTKALRTDPESVNVDVFRIRKRFGQHFRNAVTIIERRPRTRQLRLGVASFEIRTL